MTTPELCFDKESLLTNFYLKKMDDDNTRITVIIIESKNPGVLFCWVICR